MSTRTDERAYYWARMRNAFHAEPTWQPVLLVRAGHQVIIGDRAGPPAQMRWDVFVVGDDTRYGPEDVTEWGAQLRPLAELLAELPTGITSVLRGEPKPITPAGRMELVTQLLAPRVVTTCPHCGQDVERTGEPLIAREDALKLLEPDE